MSVKLDQYTLRARVAPAMILALPAALTVLAWLPSGWGLITSVLTEAGGALLLASVTRHVGRDKQQKLFDMWGGRPSERLLSHQHAPNQITLRRRHDQLRALLPDVHIPTAEQEAKNPQNARDAYDACVEYLRGATRNHERFPLVFEENCNYGFARNLWAVKPWGLLVTVVGAVTLAGRLIGLFSTHQRVELSLVIPTSLVFLILLLWICGVTSSWVKGPADAYAERLLESLDDLVT